MKFLNRIPKLERIAPVYAVIVMVIYLWSLTIFIWRLPSWVYFSTVGEIAGIFAYMVVINLVESVLVLLAVVLISIVLPHRWFYDRFVTKGVSLVLLSLGYLIYFNTSIPAGTPFSSATFQKMTAIAAVIIVLVFLIDRIDFLRRLLEELANRAIVFLYISIPVSMISLLTVLIRNIF